MSNRTTTIAALAVALSVTAIAVAALSGAARNSRTDADVLTALDAPVLLPTVVVRPEAEIPVLGEINVSPSRAERLAAGLEVSGDEGAIGAVASRVRATPRTLLPGGGLAMPYYSFGKPLPRVNKD